MSKLLEMNVQISTNESYPTKKKKKNSTNEINLKGTLKFY